MQNIYINNILNILLVFLLVSMRLDHLQGVLHVYVCFAKVTKIIRIIKTQ